MTRFAKCTCYFPDRCLVVFFIFRMKRGLPVTVADLFPGKRSLAVLKDKFTRLVFAHSVFYVF